jgi:hypothetical protein
MRIARKLVASWMFFATIVVLLGWFATSPSVATAQVVAGWNTICQGSGTNCGTLLPSSSFIDASALAFGNASTDICARIYNALQSTIPPSQSIALVHPVIDARGIKNTTMNPTILTCKTNETPWVPLSGTAFATPSTILLPAGKIFISTGWILPNLTKLIGVGASDPGDVDGDTTDAETTIAAWTNFGPAGTALLQMGESSLCNMNPTLNGACFGIGISHLILNGGKSPVTIDGIDNFNAEEGSFVEHVNMYFIGGNGLRLGASGNPSSNHSGPYSDIWFEASGASETTTACVRIEGTQPRGIHGITCAANGTPDAAIYLDGENVSIEDVHVEGFQDGIVVGAKYSAHGNVVFNVTGVSSGSANGPVINAVHICNPSNPAPGSACTSFNGSVSDLTLQAIGVSGTNPMPKSIKDDLAGTTLSDASVGIYALGAVTATGTSAAYSRVSTSPNVPSFSSGSFGSAVPGGNCTVGSLLSNTTATSSAVTLYLCVPSAGGGGGPNIWIQH